MTLLLDVLSTFANTQMTALYFTVVAQADTYAILCKSEGWDIYSKEVFKKHEVGK